MASIDTLKASDGTGAASVATVQSVRAPAATTLVVDTVQGINSTFHATMGTPHTFVDPVTSETITVISESTAVDFQGHVDGTNLEIDTIAPGFTDAGSSVNDIVIIKPTTQWADEVAEVLEVSHNDNGTLKDDTVDTDQIVDLAVTTAKIADGAITASKITVGTIVTTDSSTDRTIGSTLASLSETIEITPGTWEIWFNCCVATNQTSNLQQGANVALSTSTSSYSHPDLRTTQYMGVDTGTGNKSSAFTANARSIVKVASTTTFYLIGVRTNSTNSTLYSSYMPLSIRARKLSDETS